MNERYVVFLGVSKSINDILLSPQIIIELTKHFLSKGKCIGDVSLESILQELEGEQYPVDIIKNIILKLTNNKLSVIYTGTPSINHFDIVWNNLDLNELLRDPVTFFTSSFDKREFRDTLLKAGLRPESPRMFFCKVQDVTE